MKKLINDLRQKPQRVKSMVALGTSAVVTGLIGIIWISSFVATGLNKTNEVEAKQTSNSPSPFTFVYNHLASISTAISSFGIATTSNNSKSYVPSDTVEISADGAIGVSTTNKSPTDSSDINSSTQE